MNIVAVVPVRLSSTRFPGKPLADLDGRPLVQWVYEAAARCPAFGEVLVATDSDEIGGCVRGFGGRVELTRPDHRTGTDRVAEVAERRPEADVVVNVQGDQPFTTAEMLTTLVQPYLAGERPAMTTLACSLTDRAQMGDPNVVKVVCDLRGDALYFSRSAIPYDGGEGPDALHHLGLYAFTREALLTIPSLESTPLERAEQLEQLRALEHGHRIRVCRTDRATLEINTPADLDRARSALRSGAIRGA